MEIQGEHSLLMVKFITLIVVGEADCNENDVPYPLTFLAFSTELKYACVTDPSCTWVN